MFFSAWKLQEDDVYQRICRVSEKNGLVIELTFSTQEDITNMAYNMDMIVEALQSGDIQYIGSIIDAGFDVDTVLRVDNEDYSRCCWLKYTTMLLAAIQFEHNNIVKLLLDKGANPNVDDGYWTPLACAIHYDNHEVVKHLLQHKTIEINIVLGHGSAVRYAVESDDIEYLKVLVNCSKLDIHADDNIISHNGRDILHTAIRRSNIDIIRYLIDDVKMVVDISHIDTLLNETDTTLDCMEQKLEIGKILYQHGVTRSGTSSSDCNMFLAIMNRNALLEKELRDMTNMPMNLQTAIVDLALKVQTQ